MATKTKTTRKKTTRKSTASKSEKKSVSPTEPVVNAVVKKNSDAGITFTSPKPFDYFFRLDVLITLSLFFLLVATVISFTVLRQEIDALKEAVTLLEEITVER